MLVNGQWTKDWHPVQSADAKGRFQRQISSFRNWITADGAAGPTGTGGYKAEAGRYRLYVALICPWASRTLIARRLKHLEPFIEVTVVNPALSDQGWAFGGFEGADTDPLFGARHLHELYTRAEASYTGRATVPLLWDTKTNTAVSNESADILRMFDSAFDALAARSEKLYPADLDAEIEALNAEIYDALNNGVYKAGFASSQAAYDEAEAGVFAMLERLEARLKQGPYLFGARLTAADVRLFVTLIRFDAAYYGLFKTNRKQIADYPLLSAYMERVLAQEGVAQTVNLAHIKAGYYSIKALNPLGIVPQGPDHIEALLAKYR